MDYDLEARADAIEELAPISQGGSGQVVTLTYQPAPTYDPTTSTTTVPSRTTQTCSGIERAIAAFRINGTTILDGDSSFMLSPVTTTGAAISLPDQLPQGSTLTLADGSVKAIVRLERIAPAGRLAYAKLQLRGSRPAA